MGAIIISDQAWKRVPANLRNRLKRIVRSELATLTKENVKIERSAITTMERYGLNRIELTDAEKAIWLQEFTDNREVREVIDKVFDRSIYNRIERLVREYRNRRQ